MVKRKTNVRSATPADIELGTKIRIRRIEQHMSQSELADMLGVSFQQVQKYEKGVNRVAAARLLVIASALDVSTDYFMGPSTKQESALNLMLTDSGAQRLLRAYSRIEDHMTRHRFVSLLESVAA